LAAAPGTVAPIDAAILRVQRVRFFKGEILGGKNQKYHVTVGHQTVMAEVTFLSLPLPRCSAKHAKAKAKATASASASAEVSAEAEAAKAISASQEAQSAKLARLDKMSSSMSGMREAAQAASDVGFDFDMECAANR
jgi:hypothetical protein